MESKKSLEELTRRPVATNPPSPTKINNLRRKPSILQSIRSVFKRPTTPSGLASRHPEPVTYNEAEFIKQAEQLAIANKKILDDLPEEKRNEIIKIMVENQKAMDQRVEDSLAKIRAAGEHWYLRLNILQGLRVMLSTTPIKCLETFSGRSGPRILLDAMKRISLQDKQLECEEELLHCFRAFTNNKVTCMYFSLDLIGVWMTPRRSM